MNTRKKRQLVRLLKEYKQTLNQARWFFDKKDEGFSQMPTLSADLPNGGTIVIAKDTDQNQIYQVFLIHDGDPDIKKDLKRIAPSNSDQTIDSFFWEVDNVNDLIDVARKAKVTLGSSQLKKINHQ